VASFASKEPGTQESAGFFCIMSKFLLLKGD